MSEGTISTTSAKAVVYPGPAEGLARFKMVVEYNGTDYSGWQRQENAPSIQQTLEEAVEAFCGVQVFAQAAGRTDAGVHSSGQVVHLDLPEHHIPMRVMGALNAHLRPAPIAVRDVERAKPGFHARFSATSRRYLYRIQSRRAPAALDQGRVWWVPVTLNVEAMQEAAFFLVGTHDFSTFRAAACQAKSPVKTLNELRVEQAFSVDGIEEIHIHAEAPSFLHHQIRNIAGTLGLVGRGSWEPRDVQQALEKCDRRAGGPTAPASGLCLAKVEYADPDPIADPEKV
ncbi:MAG: tRNA pseudouridine(38-40) synthase TruA [Pseudomonadota bacterium]